VVKVEMVPSAMTGHPESGSGEGQPWRPAAREAGAQREGSKDHQDGTHDAAGDVLPQVVTILGIRNLASPADNMSDPHPTETPIAAGQR
jgi:hypothetical protein